MYKEFFGLRENPFALSPDPRYLYLSQRHQDALAHLMYGITGSGGFVLLTGEVGTGKTLMVRTLLQRLPDTVDVALVLYPFLTVSEFMLALCDDLKIARPADPSLKTLIDTLNAHLLDSHARGRHTVLIVDEAHRLNREVLEQIRLLTNLETTKQKLLQIVLVGQPELNEVLLQPEMRQLTQRITARFDLEPLSANETAAYVAHRCEVAGAQAALFTRAALWAVHRRSRGVPRLINLVCDRALLAAYARARSQVGWLLAQRAAREVEVDRRTTRWSFVAFAVAMLLTGAVLAGVWKARIPESLWSGFVAQSATANVPSGAKPAATNVVAPPGGTSASDIMQILADARLPTDTETAFSQLFARWKLDYAALEGATGCERAQQAGLRCLFESGTWNNLRQINRPAIVELADAAGTRHHVLLARLNDEQATLEFPGQRFDVSLSEMNRVWFGKYLVLWSPPQTGEQPVRRGMSGPQVSWVRDVLVRSGVPANASAHSDVFDVELESQVRQFQRLHQLQDDGIVGRMTLIYLSAYDGQGSMPRLSGPETTMVR